MTCSAFPSTTCHLPHISHSFSHQALEDVAAIMSSLGLEWWPCRGTLIALLRHGARSGALAAGRRRHRRDVVDHDVDVMVGVPSVSAWSSTLRWLVDAQLRQRGENWKNLEGTRLGESDGRIVAGCWILLKHGDPICGNFGWETHDEARNVGAPDV